MKTEYIQCYRASPATGAMQSPWLNVLWLLQHWSHRHHPMHCLRMLVCSSHCGSYKMVRMLTQAHHLVTVSKLSDKVVLTLWMFFICQTLWGGVGLYWQFIIEIKLFKLIHNITWYITIIIFITLFQISHNFVKPFQSTVPITLQWLHKVVDMNG